eukprot:363472-Prymnesium_polylepis.1
MGGQEALAWKGFDRQSHEPGCRHGRVDRSQVKDHVLVWSGSRACPLTPGRRFYFVCCRNLGPHSLRSTPNCFRQ